MTRIDRFSLSRRALLRGLGMGPALLPMLEFERASACAGASGPKRTFILVWPDGMIAKTASTWAMSGTAYAGSALPPHMASLEPYRNDMILMDGLDYDFIKDSPNPSHGEVSGHACFQGMLTGAFYQSFGSSTANDVGGGISVDQYLGNSLKASGYKGIPTLNLQAYSRSTARLSWVAAGQPVLPNYDPFNVFSTVFAGTPPTTAVTPTTTMTGTATPAPMTAVDKAMLMRKSILDSVVKDLTRFSASVGTADRARIDSHLTFVRGIETNLQSMLAGGAGTGAGGSGGSVVVTRPSTGTCTPPPLGATLAADALKQSANFPAVTKMMIDIAVGAFAADATRVVVLQLGDQANPDIVLTELGFVDNGVQDGNTGGVNAIHSIAHRNGTEKVKVDTWFMEKVAYALGQLKSVSDGAKTLLDSTAFLALNNMRTGIHEYVGVPAILAGRGDYFSLGRSLALTGTRNNNVLCSLTAAMGFPTPTFGEAQYGGELAALKG